MSFANVLCHFILFDKKKIVKIIQDKQGIDFMITNFDTSFSIY